MSALSILYRGRLASCNYDCPYCPFAKTHDDRAALLKDAAELRRFVDWVVAAPERISILFTPWGEGLVRRHYRDALTRLSHSPNVARVAIQTNLCVGLRWLEAVDRDRLALWCTYHPGQVRRDAFLARCARLRALGIRHSVGIVGLREHFDEIDAVRAALPEHTYLWINAYDGRDADYYSAADVARLARIDPHFPDNLAPPPSLGALCRAGETVVSVDGAGNVRRCHFVRESLGNLYDGSFRAALRPRTCPNPVCDCFIGYVHRKDAGHYERFGDGVLERVLARQTPASATPPEPPSN
jgi:MoaA/NifB/PqqE/SkfB family radical SAM enzyme